MTTASNNNYRIAVEIDLFHRPSAPSRMTLMPEQKKSNLQHLKMLPIYMPLPWECFEAEVKTSSIRKWV